MLSGKDSAGNESGLATLTINNIDKIAPTVIFGNNGESNVSIASTTVNVNDNLSGVNLSTLKYVWSTSATEPSSGWTSFSNGDTLTYSINTTYYLWIKCSDNVGYTTTVRTNPFTIVFVSSINLNYASYNIIKGNTFNLTATVLPDNATNKAITWKSNNTSVATVNQSGLVTGVDYGTAVITACASDGSNILQTCTVSITNTNLYTNSSFESSFEGVSSSYGISSAKVLGSPFDGGTQKAYVGNNVFFIDGSASDVYAYINKYITVTAGKTYTISFYYMTASIVSTVLNSSYFMTNLGTHPISFNITLTNKIWTRTSTVWTCPQGVTWIQPRFGFRAGGYTWMAVDAVKIEEGTVLTDY